MNKSSSAVPVVMYHSVGRPIPEWEWSFLTVPYKIFENHLQWLVKARYQTVDLYELYAHVSGEKQLPERSVVLTFDDGYLDNWGYVAPLLSKYGLKGTVFVNPEFVDPREITRPTLEDAWSGKIQEQDVPVRGFMSWPELKSLAEYGPLSVQSHAMSHTWYPSGNKIIDFHHPDDVVYWLDWNQYPDDKPFYLKKLKTSKVAWGTPIYEHGTSLAVRQFFPDAETTASLITFVERNGGKKLFSKLDWREKLFTVARKAEIESKKQGYFESEAEQKKRYLYELTESRKILEKQLGKPMDFLCWPGGGYNQCSLELALQIYSAVTMSSVDKSPVKNRVGEDARFIRRVGVPCFEKMNKAHYFSGRYLVYFLGEFRRKKLYRRFRQLLKIYEIGKAISFINKLS